MKLSPLLASIVLVASGSGLAVSPVSAEETPIVVLSAVFGPAKSARPVDFTERLAETCGPYSTYCQAFCTRAAVARSPKMSGLFFRPHSICRVTYRCGSTLTRITEADENDTFNLSCKRY